MDTVSTLDDFWGKFAGTVKGIGPVDIIDMLVVAYIVYKLIHHLKETRAAQLVKGLVIYFGAFLLVSVAQMQTVQFIMQYLLDNALILLVVVFQPELRRALEQIGRSKLPVGLFSGHPDSEEAMRLKWQNAIASICEAASSLSRTQTGALMVIEQQVKLGDIIKTGTIIDSDPSMELIGNIFFPNSPLHDGAMIIRDGRLYAAGCFLPLSTNYEISKQLGTRHRAALGMSENSDSLVIVVSEETGYITVARNGALNINLSIDQLRKILEDLLLKEDKEEKGDKKSGFWKGKNNK
ncbi:TIGR00159 family protein [Clostridiaceae bacterium NSJ-31]|uniref:Diadenylate cyclase n=1 Tax=Ligaoa zhengdingensis TaxID=2763658 RepID=A0A926DWF3_9FIRM|nr:diadenylate cyclase CdaA [Ligaoa zhengdingensis]MBC8545321.1 TIGR00159 family protein [Ligaoa zhengdingensis]